MSTRPARLLGLDDAGTLAPGAPADLIVVDLEMHSGSSARKN